MKKKILLIGWEHHVWETMKTRELKGLAETFDIVFAQFNIRALDEIAKAKFQDQNPIYALVFHRNILVGQPEKCKLIADFASEYSKTSFIAINMIFNDQDRDARDYAVSANFAQQGDWQQIAVIIDNSIK